MSKELSNEQKEILRIARNELTPQERKDVRQRWEWENCLDAWLDSKTPETVREGMKNPEKLKIYLDGRTMRLLQMMDNGVDESEAMETLFPMQVILDEDGEEEEWETIDPDESEELKAKLMEGIEQDEDSEENDE